MKHMPRFSLEQRCGIIKKAFLASDISLISEKTICLAKAKASIFKVVLDGQEVSLYLIVKMVSGSGWSWRPDILRVQVASLEDAAIPPTSKKGLSAILGIALLGDKTIFVLWNPGMYVFHKTNRSCYISKTTLDKALAEGFVACDDRGQYVMAAPEANLRMLFSRYLTENSIEVLS
jgi:hypothetical protein